MKYSGYIDGLLAEAAFAKKTGDASWLLNMMSQEEDPIKMALLREVCSDEFISGVKRNSQWLQKEKNRLESLALEKIEEEQTDRIIKQMERSLKKEENDEESSKGDVDGEESSSSENLSEKDTKENWEKMRSEAMQKYKENLEKKQQEKQMRDIEESMTNDTPGFGRGKAEEQLRRMENQTLKKIPASLRKLARMIGRTGGFDIEMGKSFSRASKSDNSGITIGDDLNSLLPSEIAVLSDRRTQDIFYKNYAEKRLQVFASASNGEKKKERQDGPVIICLDTSSSMNGEPARIARMLTIAVSIYAMRRRRKVMVVKYSDSYKIETFIKRRADRDRLMKFLQWTGVGGNSENRMFRNLLETVLPQEPKFDAADILCISDFGWEGLNKDIQELIAKAKSDGMKFYGLVVGHSSWSGFRSEQAIKICDSRWQWLNGECVNIDKENSEENNDICEL